MIDHFTMKTASIPTRYFGFPLPDFRLPLVVLIMYVAPGAVAPAGQASAPSIGGPTSGSDEVVTIPEFQVSTTRERDAWFASTAMSGTRTAAPIIELPYQVQ